MSPSSCEYSVYLAGHEMEQQKSTWADKSMKLKPQTLSYLHYKEYTEGNAVMYVCVYAYI